MQVASPSCSFRLLYPRLRCRSYSTLSDTIGKVPEFIKQAAGRSSQHEGAQEGGLRVLIFGKPGSGKGTLSARLVQKYDLNFISTGDVLRREIAAKSPIGKVAEEIVASGGLLSDEFMLKLIQGELDKIHGKSWILDGFPRTLRQGEMLDKALNAQGRPFNMIVHLAVPDAVILKRISARWIHVPSGRVYNTSFGSSAPKVPGLDDITGEPLSRRPDDNPQTFSRRLQTYHDTTSPLLDYFAEHYPSSLHSLEGATSDEVKLASTFSYHAESPDLTLASAPSDNIIGIEKIWPQLEKIIDPYGLQRQDRLLTEKQVEPVRKEADDLIQPVVEHTAEVKE